MFIGVRARLACHSIDGEYRELCAQYDEHLIAEIGYIARWLSVGSTQGGGLAGDDVRNVAYAAETLADLAEIYSLSPDGVQRLLFIAEPGLSES